MSSASEYWSDDGQGSFGIGMCETCRSAPWKPRTSSAAGSPVNLFRSLDGKKARVIRAGCGPRSPVWWMRYDPVTSSWRTCPTSDGLEVPRSSLILPRWGTTRNGVSYLLPPLEHLISEDGSSLWPTPTAHDDNKSPEAHMAMKERMPGGPRRKPTSLQVMVKGIERGMWPSPTARDAQTVRKAMRGQGSLEAGNEIIRPLVVQAWESTEDGRPIQPTGLNPEWVEWLQGFPEGWTDSER